MSIDLMLLIVLNEDFRSNIKNGNQIHFAVSWKYFPKGVIMVCVSHETWCYMK